MIHDMTQLAALSFLRGYDTLELSVIGFVAFVLLCLLGLMTNGILGARGFGIAGNAVLVAAGSGVAIYVHDWLLRQPAFTAWNIPPRPLLIALAAFFGLFVLLSLSFMKRASA